MLQKISISNNVGCLLKFLFIFIITIYCFYNINEALVSILCVYVYVRLKINWYLKNTPPHIHIYFLFFIIDIDLLM